jgi:23S rRNA pseudouridine1911/1915/1917 synthase
MKKTTIEILYEDKDILAINKPAGLVVHADGRTIEPTVADWVLENYPKTKDVGEPITLTDGRILIRPGIVHRLDRDTSGVLLIAKTQKGFDFLKAQFQNREAKKAYHMFVYGRVKNDSGTIDRPIGRSKNDFRMWTAQRGSRGEMRDAVTEYDVLGRGEGVSFLEARPLTGRTHQIRVHFKAINYAVVSDPLYAPKMPSMLGFTRTALHARSIRFTLLNGKVMKIEAPYPEDFEKAIKTFKTLAQ